MAAALSWAVSHPDSVVMYVQTGCGFDPNHSNANSHGYGWQQVKNSPSTAPRCPWQNPFVERVIGSLRRECLDHVIVWNERALRRHLQRYVAYLSRVPHSPLAG